MPTTETDSMDTELKKRSKKEDKGSGKIKHISITVLDDGNFHVETRTGGKDGEMFGGGSKSKTFAFGSVEELLAGIKDDVTSPHMKESKDSNREKRRTPKQDGDTVKDKHKEDLGIELENYPNVSQSVG